MSVFDQMMLKEREAGLAIGREEGREEGLEQGARNSLLFLLKKKFKRVPRRITARIGEIRDLTVLQSLNVSAGMSGTLEEFEADMV